jgi:hypothetical protein
MQHVSITFHFCNSTLVLHTTSSVQKGGYFIALRLLHVGLPQPPRMRQDGILWDVRSEFHDAKVSEGMPLRPNLTAI